MRVMITGQTYYPGNNGQAIFTIHLAEGLARAGHAVAVVVPSWKVASQQERINGVLLYKIRSLNFRWLHPEASYTYLTAGPLRRIFREFRPDIIHIQDHYFLSRDAARAGLKRGIPVMGTNHFLPENLLPYWQWFPTSRARKIDIFWRLMLWTYNHLALVTTPTETAARILLNQPVRVPVEPVSCGVDTEQFRPAHGLDCAAMRRHFGLDPNRRLFLYVGRVDCEKRIDLLLHGLARLMKSGRRDIQLAVAGQGAEMGHLQALARSLGLDEQVRFLGYVPAEHLPKLYQCADVFAMPSPEELQSIATLEAMASGRPVLAANARALPELVTTRENGYLFEPGCARTAAEGMAYLLDHQHEWPRMGRASRTRAMAHSLENTIFRYEEIYERVTGRSSRSQPIMEPVREPARVG